MSTRVSPTLLSIALLGLAPVLLVPGLHAADSPGPDPAGITVRTDRPGPAVSPLLWGIFFEDINHSADGGIYPELVRNRSFEDAAEPQHWTLEPTGSGRGEWAIDTEKPLNPYNRRSLRVRISEASAAAKLNLVNLGYWGMGVTEGADYRLSLAVRAADGFAGPLEVRLERATGECLARGELAGAGPDWKTLTLDLRASGTDPRARLVLAFASPGTVWLDMVSLLPKTTWKGHGLRPDLAGMLEGLRPAFVRFPGGCWVEGHDLAHSYRWKETIGDVAHRRPLYNLWQYHATHGLGYHEYLVMCEDLGAKPLFVINCGMSHSEVVPMDQMGPLVQDALDALEYANGPVDSVWGGLRARNGHPAPFGLEYLEIGNENGGPAYHERYALMARAVKARYPQVQIIANEWGGLPTNAPIEIVDEHYYSNPEFFIGQADRYDRYNRAGPKIYVGEYAVTQDCGQGNLRGALGEAAFMTGMERNSDVVIMSSYAPLFVNVNYRKWNPDLINFDSARVYGLPSYYVQQMFSEHRGDVVLPLEVQSPVVATGFDGGAIGVGTWLTQAEFKDIQVTRAGQTLFSAATPGAAGAGRDAWKLLGGDWHFEEGVVRQSSLADNVRAVAGDKAWTDYTLTLKARKLGGAEGFLILFRVQDENRKSWWNLGGWGNQRHAIEMGGIVGKEVPGRIETGRWYDIRIELAGRSIKCYLDGQLLHDVAAPALKSLHASATRVKASGEVVLKVVNVGQREQPTEVRLEGLGRITRPARAIVLTSAHPTDENSLDEPRKVAPVERTLTLDGPRFRHVFPGNSVTVLRLEGE